jgi:uncharacterized membrane-anchored protein
MRAYLTMPLADPAGVSKPVAMAVLAPVVVLGGWWMVRRIRAKFE